MEPLQIILFPLVITSIVICAGNDKTEYFLRTQGIFEGKFHIFDDEKNLKELKWLEIYSFADKSKVLRINQKILQNNESAEYKLFKPTPNHIILKPDDFKRLFLFLSLSNENKLEILNENNKIIVFRSIQPFFISIFKKYQNDIWRGLSFDWSEINGLLRNASQIMHDLGI